jgi:serine/threonine protein kinase
MRRLGRYLLRERLGSGAFATVWRGYDPELDSPVAVKVLAENWAVDGDVSRRFLSEARLLRRIAHPAVVRVHDVGTADGDDGLARPYFVMDLVEGGTLESRIGSLPPAEALALAADAADAVQVLHDEGVVHRDVKPSNLLVDTSGPVPRVLVADLGSAKLLAEASTLTVVTGSPAYMAPEQARNEGDFDARADVHALGAVAYHLLSGRLPYDVDSPRAARDRTAGPPPPIARELGLPPAVDAVLARALAVDPADRFTSCAELAAALRDAAAGRAVAWPRRREPGWPLAVVVSCAVLLFLLAGAAAWRLSG